MLRLMFAFGAMLTLAAWASQQPPKNAPGGVVMEPAGSVVTLKGVIRLVHAYGPPGYGEDKKHDERVTYLALELPYEINVPCTPERPEWATLDCPPVKRMKLFFPLTPSDNGLEAKTRKLVGEEANVTGVLHKSETLGEMTDIYMDVADIRAAQSPR